MVLHNSISKLQQQYDDNDNDDEDETESSIFDLIHAAPPPNVNQFMNISSNSLFGHTSSTRLTGMSGSHLPPQHPMHRSLSPIPSNASNASNNNASISNMLLLSSSNSVTTNNNQSSSKSLTQMLLRRTAAIAGGGDNLAYGGNSGGGSVTTSSMVSPIKATTTSRLYSSAQNLSYDPSRSGSSYDGIRRHSSFSPSTPRQKSIFGMNRNSLANLSMLVGSSSSSNTNEDLTMEILRRRHNSVDGSFFPVLELGTSTSNDDDNRHRQNEKDVDREDSIEFDTLFAPSSSSASSSLLRGNKKKTRLEQLSLSASNGIDETGSKENNNNLGNKSPHTTKKVALKKNNSKDDHDDNYHDHDENSAHRRKTESTNNAKPSVQQQHLQQSTRSVTPLSSLSEVTTIDNSPLFKTTKISNKKKKEKPKGPNKNDMKQNTSSTTTSDGRTTSGILNASFSNLLSSVTRLTRSISDGTSATTTTTTTTTKNFIPPSSLYKNSAYGSTTTTKMTGSSLVEKDSMLHTPNMDLIECDDEDDADESTRKTDFQNSDQLGQNSLSTTATHSCHNNNNSNKFDNSTRLFQDQGSSHQNHSSFQSESTVTNNFSNTLSYTQQEDDDSTVDDQDHDTHPDHDNPIDTDHDDTTGTEEMEFYDNHHANNRVRQYSTDLNRSDCIILEEDYDEENEIDENVEEEKTEVEKDGTETSEYSLNSTDYDIYGQSNNAIKASKLHQSIATDMNHYLGSHSNLDYEFDDDDDDDGDSVRRDDDNSDDNYDSGDHSDANSTEDDEDYDDEEYQRRRSSNLRKSKRGSLPLVSRIGSKKFGQSASSLMSNDTTPGTPGTPGRHNTLRGSFPRSGSFIPKDSSRHNDTEMSPNDTDRRSRDRRGSASPDTDDNDDDDSGNHDSFRNSRQQSSTRIRKNKRPTILGQQMPKYMYWLLCCCCTFGLNHIDYRFVASIIVTKLPCFWHTSFPHTEQSILGRLNLLSALFALIQVASCLYLYIIMFTSGLVDRDLPDTSYNENEEDETPEYELTDAFNASTWNPNGSTLALGVCAIALTITNIFNIRVIRSVDIAGSIRYLWMLSWILPVQTFFVLSLLDYYQVTHVWVQFSWRHSIMAIFRHYYCEPQSTANTLCAVPLFPNEAGAIQWCQTNFNSTDCATIRNNAQERTKTFFWTFYTCNAIWGTILIALLFIVIKILERIISIPLLQKSREASIPSWLLLPAMSCVAMGCIFTLSPTSIFNLTYSLAHGETVWIGPMFIIAGGLFFVGSLLGWFMSAYTILSTRDKRTKSVAILTFISLMGTLLIMMASIFTVGVLYSISLGRNQISEQRRGVLACAIDQGLTCSGCDGFQNRCPEWSDTDINKIIQSQAKSSAVLAIICVVYAVIALRYGFNARKNLSLYQIEYV